MRPLAFWLIPALLVLSFAAVAQSLDDLKARADKARPEDQIGICLQIAKQDLARADKLFTDGDAEQAHAAVREIVTYSEKARDAALQTKKHQKDVEISVRKLSEKLRDIKRTLAFEDQPAVEKAIQELESIRTALLKEMFSKEKKK